MSCQVGLEITQGYWDDVINSFKIDTKLGRVLDHGEIFIPGNTVFEKGSVISVENIYTWSVNDSCLASREFDGTVDIYAPEDKCDDVYYILNVHGQVTLMNFKYT